MRLITLFLVSILPHIAPAQENNWKANVPGFCERRATYLINGTLGHLAPPSKRKSLADAKRTTVPKGVAYAFEASGIEFSVEVTNEPAFSCFPAHKACKITSKDSNGTRTITYRSDGTIVDQSLLPNGNANMKLTNPQGESVFLQYPQGKTTIDAVTENWFSPKEGKGFRISKPLLTDANLFSFCRGDSTVFRSSPRNQGNQGRNPIAK